MITECIQYGHLWDSSLSDKCLVCYPRKKKHRKPSKKDSIRAEINSFRRDSIGELKKLNASQRKSDVSKYERMTGKQVYQ